MEVPRWPDTLIHRLCPRQEPAAGWVAGATSPSSSLHPRAAPEAEQWLSPLPGTRRAFRQADRFVCRLQTRLPKACGGATRGGPEVCSRAPVSCILRGLPLPAQPHYTGRLGQSILLLPLTGTFVHLKSGDQT